MDVSAKNLEVTQHKKLKPTLCEKLNNIAEKRQTTYLRQINISVHHLSTSNTGLLFEK